MAETERYADAWKKGYAAIKHILRLTDREDLTNAQKVRATEFISKYSIILFHAILSNDSSEQRNIEINRLIRPVMEEYTDVTSILKKDNNSSTYSNHGNNKIDRN